MTVRTLIEVTGNDHHEHDRDLKATLDKLGYEPKDSPDEARWKDDLYTALTERGLIAWQLVEELRKKRG